MKQKCTYIVGNKKVEFVSNNIYKFGKKIILSNSVSDISFSKSWYKKGYSIYRNVFTKKEFTSLKKKITLTIENILKKEKINTKYFSLENYHNFIKDENTHNEIVKMTSELFQENIFFKIDDIIEKLEKATKLSLSQFFKNKKMHIIIRIVRPSSSDFNPVHKDIYDSYDKKKKLLKILNFWIPICGVNLNSALTLVPSSHLIPENKILRTYTGAVINNQKYRVNNILSWDGQNELTRVPVKYKSVLAFSSHLIHGLGINYGKSTRIALEFRLYKK